MPVKGREEVFGFFKGMGNVTLNDMKLLRQERGYKIAIRIVANNQIRFSTKFTYEFFFYI